MDGCDRMFEGRMGQHVLASNRIGKDYNEIGQDRLRQDTA